LPLQSAQRLRDERDELQYKLDQVSLEATMGAALAETQKLKDVADEFERDLYEQKLAEAGARGAEVEALKERVAELEDENAGEAEGTAGGMGWRR
jgi:polyhydroxyalkanoate synthesis regulator phasin